MRLPIGTLALDDELRRAVRAAPGPAGREIIVGMRPEHFEDAALVSSGQHGGATFTAKIDVLESLGFRVLANHCDRAELWAASLGRLERIPYDGELLYVASMLHDGGLLPAFDNHLAPFEGAGGDVGWVLRGRRLTGRATRPALPGRHELLQRVPHEQESRHETKHEKRGVHVHLRSRFPHGDRPARRGPARIG